jgi:predicted nucleic acid-binding protein
VNGVIEASALVNFLLGAIDDADVALFDGSFSAPDILLVETASGLRRSELRGVVSGDLATALLADMLEMPVELVDSRGLVERAFELRHSMTVQDASYVALAEQLGCGLLTSDRRLARSPGLTVPVTVV